MDISKKNRNTVVEESAKTKKAREKLRKKLEDYEKKITPQALEKKTYEIHHWIALHAPNRVVLRSKNICLFDSNQNAAKSSKKVSAFAEQLKCELEQEAGRSAESSNQDFYKRNISVKS